MKLKPHRLAELLPLMSEAEFEALKQDISVNGQRDPVMLFEGKILDGRHTYRAVTELGLKPRIGTFKGSEDDALAFVYSSAVRRNMTDSQKAASAVRFLPLFEKAAASRLKTRAHGTSSNSLKGAARDHAGALFGVSGRYVSDARMIFEKSPDLFEQVFNGTLVITRAKRQMMLAHKRDVAKSLARSGRLIHPENCELIIGDAVKEMTKLPRRKFRFIFADPPYNLGFEYLDDPTHDDLSPTKYLNMIRRAVEQAKELLTADGAICLMICEEWVAEFGMILKEAGFHIRRLIVWYESFGQAGQKNFGRTCRYIWYAVKDPSNFVFDGASILTESKRQTHYNDKRAADGGKVPDALWDFARLCGTFGERVLDEGVPTQLPIELVKRAIKCFTDPGDAVLDPFAGTGTTARAALRLDRTCTLIERSKKYGAIITRELAAMSVDAPGKVPEWAKREQQEISRVGKQMLVGMKG